MTSNLFQQIIFGDYVEVIAKFLSPKDIINLCKIYPKHWSRLYPQFKASVIKVIDDWFREYFGNKYEEFRKAMILDKAVLSGSFILQAILEEKWEGTDIDFFVSLKNVVANKKLYPSDIYALKFYSHLQYFLFSEPDVEDEADRHILADSILKRYRGLSIDFDEIREYKIESKRNQHVDKFQVIELNKTIDIFSFIDSTFDFDICKNTFYYDKNGINLKILNARDIINKSTGFKPCINLKSSLERCKKYTARGFKFYDAIDQSHYQHNGAHAAFNKLQKQLAN